MTEDSKILAEILEELVKRLKKSGITVTLHLRYDPTSNIPWMHFIKWSDQHISIRIWYDFTLNKKSIEIHSAPSSRKYVNIDNPNTNDEIFIETIYFLHVEVRAHLDSHKNMMDKVNILRYNLDSILDKNLDRK